MTTVTANAMHALLGNSIGWRLFVKVYKVLTITRTPTWNSNMYLRRRSAKIYWICALVNLVGLDRNSCLLFVSTFIERRNWGWGGCHMHYFFSFNSSLLHKKLNPYLFLFRFNEHSTKIISLSSLISWLCQK